MDDVTTNKKLTDEEYIKHAKEVIKQMFKQFAFAAIMAILTIPAITYIVFGSDESLKILFWIILLLINIPALLLGIKTLIKTKNSTLFIYTMALIAICTLIMFRIFGWVDNTIAIAGFLILSVVAMIPFFFHKQKCCFRIAIREDDKIEALFGSYSDKPYSKKSEIIREIVKNLSFKEISLRFARLLGKEGIIIDYVAYDNRIKMFPSFPYDGSLGPLLFLKRKDSYIEINKDGDITAFVSLLDYLQTPFTVSHSALCQNLAEKFEYSFVEFVKRGKLKI